MLKGEFFEDLKEEGIRCAVESQKFMRRTNKVHKGEVRKL
jgi:hypothetical protein